jgi:protein gp37
MACPIFGRRQCCGAAPAPMPGLAAKFGPRGAPGRAAGALYEFGTDLSSRARRLSAIMTAMADRSAIEWTDATWNPVTGCTKVSPGCRFCYAERLTARFGRGPFTEVMLHRDRLFLPLRWREPRRIFVNSMSDLFHERVPDDFIASVIDTARLAPYHVFQILTKRADRMLQWHHERGATLPSNVWFGVSVESMRYAWRVDRLRLVDVAVRFVSAEPLLGSLRELDLRGIAWVITGGESGGTSARALVERSGRGWRPKPEALRWVRELRSLCQHNAVAFFHKQWGGPRPTSGGRTLDGRVWEDMPLIAETSVRCH